MHPRFYQERFSRISLQRESEHRPLSETSAIIFQYVLCITTDHVNNSMFLSISTLFPNLVLCFVFFSPQEKKVNIALSETTRTPLNNCAFPQKCQQFLGCGESGCQNLSSVLQLK